MPESAPPQHSSHMLSELQGEVQRKLGACVVQVQLYELLMKAIVEMTTLEGISDTLEAERANSAAEISDKSLGRLIQEHVLKDLIVNVAADGNDSSRASDKELHAIAQGLPYLKIRHQIGMKPEELAIASQGLEAMLKTRNQLVHHFVARFDLKSDESCAGAMDYLEKCQAMFDMSLAQLKGWAAGMVHAQQLIASFAKTQIFEDLVVNGINPDGTIDWPACGVVEALREAEVACAKESWTLLDSAIAWLRADHSDQAPAKYRCKTWKQVLKRSKQFEIRVAVDPVSNHGQTWFRSRAVA